jgi:hypothetical protein
VTRLIGQHVHKGEVKQRSYRRHRFPVQYTRIDTAQLAAVDEAHDTLSGPATRKILQREFEEYGKAEYQRLAGLSVAHLYRLRNSRSYRIRRTHFSKTSLRRCQSASGDVRSRKGGPGTFAWTLFTKAIRTELKACITSTPLTR